MTSSTPDATCRQVCLGVSALAGFLALWITWGPFIGLAALMFAGAFGAILFFTLSSMVCAGEGMARSVGVALGLEKDTRFARYAQASADPEPGVVAEPAIETPSKTAHVPDSDPAKPQMLSAPEGTPDDLTKIKGIGPKLAALCNEMGVYHYHQIAGWEAGDVAWMDDNLTGFRGRVSRDGWVAQAKALAQGETRVENRDKTTKDASKRGNKKKT